MLELRKIDGLSCIVCLDRDGDIQAMPVVAAWQAWAHGWRWYATALKPGGQAFGLVCGYDVEWGTWEIARTEALPFTSKLSHADMLCSDGMLVTA